MCEIVIDGHEKVSSRCSIDPPAHGGRPRKDGTSKRRTNGWFMAVHPDSGLIIGVQEMIHPENNDLAVGMLEDAADFLPALDCIIYDRMCCALQAVRKSDMLKDIKYFCVDKFHAHGHAKTCPCSPLVHKKLNKRLREVNTSAAEQNLRLVSKLCQDIQYHVPSDALLLCSVLCAEAQRVDPEEQCESPQPLRFRPQAPSLSAVQLQQVILFSSFPSSSCSRMLAEAISIHGEASSVLEVGSSSAS